MDSLLGIEEKLKEEQANTAGSRREVKVRTETGEEVRVVVLNCCSRGNFSDGNEGDSYFWLDMYSRIVREYSRRGSAIFKN